MVPNCNGHNIPISNMYVEFRTCLANLERQLRPEQGQPVRCPAPLRSHLPDGQNTVYLYLGGTGKILLRNSLNLFVENPLKKNIRT